ncbi:hypothetical protein BDV12DRAFT_180273 [Aspergillus spectabilis]
MVFLRLTVKVYPRDQTPTSSSFSFRSLLGDRERDDASRTSSGTTTGKPASFLIVLENPDDVTLGGLAGMIRVKWRKLRPGVEPLEIKKLVDDDHESDDLDTDMTVSDVFVDKGKALSDGHDQRRTVRVIQKPAKGEESPVRFPSVALDWDAAADRYETQRREKQQKEAEFALNKLGPITEETLQETGSTSPIDIDSWSNYTPDGKHRRDIPVSSVEKDHEVPPSPSQQPRKSPTPTQEVSQEPNGEDSGASQENRLGSQELGESPRSSRATTPRKPTSRRGSTQSQYSVNQFGTEIDRVADSPGLQLVRESTHSMSPQKRLPPKETQPDPVSLDEVSQDDDESGSSSQDSDESAKSTGEQDRDGDVAMLDHAARKTQSPVAYKEPVAATSSVVGTQFRKRKNSAELSSPNKEPRLDRATTPPLVNGARRNSEVSPGTPRFSPSGRRLGGTGSFSGVARRLSFTEPSEHPVQGLGLGITRSPNKKAPVKPILSQDSAPSSLLQSTPIPAGSASPTRRGSFAGNLSTPANLKTPADKVKNLSSALRKESPVERNPERRSVSFAEGDEVLITGSQPAPRSTPMHTVKSTKIEPASQTTSSEKRRSSGMVFPPGVSPDLISRYEREATEKLKHQDQENEKNGRNEFARKLKAAEKEKLDPIYLARLKAALNTWDALLANENKNRQGAKTAVVRLRAQLDKQAAEIKEMEASMDKMSQGKGKRSAKKSPKPQQGTKEDTPASTKSTTSKSTPTSAPAVGRTSPAPQISSWNAINSKPVNSAKSGTPTANGTTPKATPKARTVATRTLGQKTTKASSLQSQNSTASDDLELPTMKVQARTNSKNPAEASSSEESTSSEEETSSDSSSSSSSDSDSDSESDSASMNKKQATETPKTRTPTRTTAQKSTTKLSSPSAQRATKSPAPSTTSQSQSQSQSQPPSQNWRWPASQSGIARPSLKSIKGDIASQAQTAAAMAAPKRNVNGPPRKDIFDRPDSDSDSDETESESSSSSSESESESESESGGGDENKGKGKKREQSPVSVGDEGDIMSTGQVRKLRPARMAS